MESLEQKSAGQISADALIDEAVAQTGIADYGDRGFEEGLRVFVDALNHDARLNAIGQIAQPMDIVRLLSNRLRFQDDLRRHPEILQEKVTAPIVIVGLPRTGTSKLQRTLAADPGVQRLEVWRLLNPARLPFAEGEPDPRIAIGETVEQMLASQAPGFMAAHPTEAHEPDEELLLLELTFQSIVHTMRNRVPSYAEWLRGRSQREPYRYMRSLLQYLQWQDGGGRGRPWILKSPAHIGQLPVLFETFPDALVVQCHRDPREVVPSFASLTEVARQMGSDDVDPAEIGAEMLELWASQVSRGLAARHDASGQLGAVLDVPYTAIRDDLDGVITQIYDRAQRPITPEARAAFIAYTAKRPANHFGRHSYTAERYGLSEQIILERFADYYEQFPELKDWR